MNKAVLFILILISSFLNNNLLAQDALSDGFITPPASAKARTWWHWINGNVSKEGITADLKAMKAVGIQEAQIFNVDQGYPNGRATFLSPDWLEMFEFAVKEAGRLGLEIGFHNGAGWSSSGGPWITPELAMQTVVFSETQVTGGKKIKVKIPQPTAKLSYYKDIAILAFPTPKSSQRIQNMDIKTLSKDAFKSHLQPTIARVEEDAVVEKSMIINLTKNLSEDGTLQWNAPPGDWTIIRFGHTPTGTENRPAGPGGKGLEVNKMSSTAVDAYWAGGVKPILDKIGSSRSSLVNCLIDSYEVGCNNWTTGFAGEFESRRKYSCLFFLPTLAGYYVESGEVSERFLWDFRKTIGDLIADNYYGKFRELCHKNGLKFSVEPYGGPFDAFQVGAYGDIAMSEFWMGRKEYSESSKLVSSISHLNGNTITGAESFTSLGGWTSHPATMKAPGDFIWTEGVNRFIYHTYVHQPWNISPGVTFHMYGVELSRLNTWWSQSKAYFDYVARSQFLLQQGQSFADALVFTGESSPNDGTARPDIKLAGYDYDQIGMHELAYLTVRQGRIYSRSGLSYRMLILPESRWATPQLLSKIQELVNNGAIVVGNKPVQSPSLTNYPDCDLKVSELANEIWNGKALKPSDFSTLARKLNLEPDFSGGDSGSDLNFIHRVSGDDDIYFISNPKDELRTEVCHFRIAGKLPELWNADKGTIEPIPVWKQISENIIQIPLTLGPNQSLFVVFRPAPADKQIDHLTALSAVLSVKPQEPLLDLQILKAEYGTFLPGNMVDVTSEIRSKSGTDRLQVMADNSLTTFDPAPGSVKSLRISYKLGEETKYLEIPENQQLEIIFEGKKLSGIRAIYGKFPDELEGMPAIAEVRNVTQIIKELVIAKNLVFGVSDSLFEETEDNQNKRDLRITYSSEGKITSISRERGEQVNLSQPVPSFTVGYKNGFPTLISPVEGTVKYTTSVGQLKTAVINKVPTEIKISKSWEVSFPNIDTAKIKKVEFSKLTSWSFSTDDDVRYFSGTASYRQEVAIPKELLKSKYLLELDLGSVHVIAEVILNGKNLGILWAPPFRVALGSAARAGINKLEIRITNLWPNRLIGDAQLNDDVTWGDYVPKEWPEWLKDDGKTRKSERVTFTTWKHWNRSSELHVSGMLGPVIIRAYSQTPLR